MHHFLLIFVIIRLFSPSLLASKTLSSFSIKNSPWHPSQNITLLSPTNKFAAGFFLVSTKSNLYLFSVWYANISDHTIDSIVWSTKWDSPVSQTASLIITHIGGLQLTDGPSKSNLWSGPDGENSNSTELTLSDEGNLVFGSWESFQHPTDTFLPNQTIRNDTVLTSRNGKYRFINSKELVFNGVVYLTRTNRFMSLGMDGQITRDGADQLLCSDFGLNRTRKLALGDDGNFRALSFDPVKRKWVPTWVARPEICRIPGLCGAGFICYSDGSTLSGYECVCPPGFKRSSGSNSCERKTPFGDLRNSKFLRLDYVIFPNGSQTIDLGSQNFDVCQSKCLSYHTCLGFGFKIDGSRSCMLQLDELLNGYWSSGNEIAFYLRVDKSESEVTNFTGMFEVLSTTCPVRNSLPEPPKDSNTTIRNIIIVVTLLTGEIVGGVLLFRTFLKRYEKYRDMAQTLGLRLLPTVGPKRFTYAEIKATTNDFANENVIGRGGFSDVYMGKLQDGRSVAVKCLKNVTNNHAEFWAEVTIIARMHHLNLVRLWGFCNEKGKRILVYEHVPNGSLDKYLFSSSHIRPNDQESHNQSDSKGVSQMPTLDWNIRYRIVLGVARAIAYLHEECLEWVLHCDIKPENILLGDDFCPKVADFGLSKLRKKEQCVTMSKIRGTPGYLAPEWTKKESLTSKVDVYSFGMVLLEIVSGVRNTVQLNSNLPSDQWYFPRWAFEMAIEEKRMDELLDRQIKHAYDDKMHFKLVDRMLKTAMWCLQERPEMRPSMGKVTKMLEGTVEIIDPPKPTIFYL